MLGGMLLFLLAGAEIVFPRGDGRPEVSPNLNFPVSGFTERRDTVPCDQANFSQWVDTRRLELFFSDELETCGPITAIDYTPKFSEPMGACETRVVNFIVTDSCGLETTIQSTYTTVDNVPPTFSGIPADVSIGCQDAVPPAPAVSVSDNCDDNVSFTFEEITVPDGTCPVYQYSVIRTWTATDACGNTSIERQVVRVVDDDEPIFNLPPDVTLSCGQDPGNLDLTGRPSNVSDNCDPNPSVSFTDQLIEENCPGAFTIQRIWRVTDACGKTTARVQNIYVVDNEAPSFIAPANITVRCTEVNNLNITGRPSQVSDNCDPNPAVRIAQEVVTQGDCPNNYQIRREWQVSDACGNVSEKAQIITVDDREAPRIIVPANDRIVDCAQEQDVTAAFQQWLTSRGGARATDDCSPEEALIWTAYNSGSLQLATLPEQACPAPGGVLRSRSVDFTAVDECNNLIVTTATFSVIDREAPSIVRCGNTETFVAAPGSCEGVYLLSPPQVEEKCSAGTRAVSRSAQSDITFKASIGQDGQPTVNPIELVFDLSGLLPVNALNDAVLTVRLFNVDGEGPGKFFNIIGEDGVVLGLTAPTNGECGNSQVEVTIPRAKIDAWSVDGRIRIRLAPNNENGQSPIADICPNPRVEGSLNFNAKRLEGMRFQYRVNNLPLELMPGGAPVEVSLPLGENKLTLIAVDCAGNVDSCSFTVVVEDREAPSITCPGDMVMAAAPGACQASIALPRLLSLTDNCTPMEQLQQQFFTTGAVNVPLTTIDAQAPAPNILFPVGETTVFHVVTDKFGNADTCAFLIVVEDREAPAARCQPTTIFINPSGVDFDIVGMEEIDVGSTDNCGIQSTRITPDRFTCEDAGRTFQITLTVSDAAGNIAECSTPVRVETLKPQPSATSGVCGNDSLYLFANPPPATGATVFTYRWTGPNGFISDKQNPVIPRVSSANAGSYVVEITGITGCTAIGTAEVSIEDLPLTPTLLTAANVCVNENIVLTSSVVPTGSTVTYRWYEGIPPNGALIGTTSTPTFTLPAPHAEANRNFYLTVEANNCLSAASSPAEVRISSVPPASVNDPEITVCEGGTITLGTSVFAPSIRYEWTGPNGFRSNDQFPPVINNARPVNAGVYKLVVSRDGCVSSEAIAIVNVLPRPAKPQLSSNSPVCEGREVVLTANAPGASIYRWLSPMLQEFTTTTNRLTFNQAGTQISGPWRLTVSQFGCVSESSDPVLVTVNANPLASASASQSVVCEGDKVQLLAAPTLPDAIYRWTGPGGYSSSSQNPVIDNVSVERAGEYRLTITTAQGCSGGDSTSIAVQRSPTITALSNDAPDCLSGPTDIRLAASVFPPDNGTYTYSWSGPGGFLSSDSVAIIPNASAANNGNYQLVVSSSAGCFSAPAITTVSMAVPPPAPSVPRVAGGIRQPYCEGTAMQLLTDVYPGGNVRYNWRTPAGITATSSPSLDIPSLKLEDAGNYSLFVTIDGCDSQESAKLNIAVGRTPRAIPTNNSPLCAGDRLELKAELVPGAVYTWVGPGFSSTQPNPVIENAQPAQNSGIYILRVTLDGCVSRAATTEVSVLATPSAPVPNNTGPVCASEPGAKLELFVAEALGASGITYTWFDPSGPIVSDTPAVRIAAPDLAKYGDAAVPFTVRAKRGGCVSALSAPTLAQINVIPPNQAFAGDDFVACEGFATNLAAVAPSQGSGRWRLVGGDTTDVRIANPDQHNTAVAGLRGNERYIFRWSLSNGACRDYSADEVSVEVTESEPVFAGEDILTCDDVQVVLNATPVSTGRAFWSQSDVQQLLGVRIENPNSPTTRVTGLEGGNLYTFSWTVIGGCGPLTDNIFVLVSDPSPFAGIDKIACNNEGFAQLAADMPTEGSRGRWSSPDPAITFSDPRRHDAIALNLSPGRNVLVWTIDDGICGDASRDTVIVNYRQGPAARPDQFEVAFGIATKFDPLANDDVPPGAYVNIVRAPEKGTVRITGDSSFVYISNANLVGEERMVYELCSEACECSQATVTFVVGRDARCDIPNIFTPNNDGVNDFFVVPCLLDIDQYPNSQVIIFNQWGDAVFRSPRPYLNDWRGTFKGEDVPPGVYYYVVDLGDGSPVSRGFVQIER
jgi:gliding motility-associated-like protein